MSFTLKIRQKKFTFDIDNFQDLCTNKSKSTAIIRWKLDNKNRPFHLDNNAKTIYLIDKIMKDKCSDNIKFIDNDIYNYCKDNLKIVDDEIIYYNEDIYKVISKIDGHTSKMGKSAGIMKNSIFNTINLNSQEIQYFMECNDEYTIISKESIKKIQFFEKQKLTWYKLANGYIGSHAVINNNDTILYLHQHLMDYYGNGLSKNTKTIDHINRDKLDNRIENLRLATQSEQNINTYKRKRKKDAKDLPDGLTQDMIPKYVTYYNECYNREKELYREFFKIEKHPKYEGIISSSKSAKKSIQDKLEEIKGYLKKIEDKEVNNSNSNSIKEEKKLPVGIRLKVKDTYKQLILDYKIDNYRYNLKMKCNSSKTFDENYQMFKNKVTKKYPKYNQI